MIHTRLAAGRQLRRVHTLRGLLGLQLGDIVHVGDPDVGQRHIAGVGDARGELHVLPGMRFLRPGLGDRRSAAAARRPARVAVRHTCC